MKKTQVNLWRKSYLAILSMLRNLRENWEILECMWLNWLNDWLNNDGCGHKWVIRRIIFTSDTVTNENYWWIASRVTTNIVINDSPHIILFLTWFSRAETQINRWKLPSIDRRSIYVALWRHANTYRDVILTDCHENVSKWVTCAFPLSSSWLSLVDYRELFTTFSQADTLVLCKKREVLF